MANDIDKKCPECGAKMTYTPADVTEGLWGCTQCNYQVSSETDEDQKLLREHYSEAKEAINAVYNFKSMVDNLPKRPTEIYIEFLRDPLPKIGHHAIKIDIGIVESFREKIEAIAAKMVKQYKLILACKTAFYTCRDVAKEIKDIGDSYDPYELITNADYIIETCKKILKEADNE